MVKTDHTAHMMPNSPIRPSASEKNSRLNVRLADPAPRGRRESAIQNTKTENVAKRAIFPAERTALRTRLSGGVRGCSGGCITDIAGFVVMVLVATGQRAAYALIPHCSSTIC